MASRGDPICRTYWLGRIDYQEAWRLQQALVCLRAEGLTEDALLLLEHPPTYTIGRSAQTGARDGHLLASRQALAALGAPVLEVDRGGSITFHGPGQLVAYPILHLSALRLRSGQAWRPDVYAYLRALEEVLIRTLADYGVAAQRWPGFTGVWVKHEKIAAIGVKVSRWVTSHGFALNVNVDLGWFRHIVPCGIRDKGVTSMEREIGRAPPLEELVHRLLPHFAKVFGRRVVPVEGILPIAPAAIS